MKKINTTINLLLVFAFWLTGCASLEVKQITEQPKQYDKTEFEIYVKESFENPYDAREIAVNMVLENPAGDSILLPCYYEKGESGSAVWKARFAPRSAGTYTYQFLVEKAGKIVNKSEKNTISAAASSDDGFLHINDFWTLKFDSGKPFRGIGENVGWESRSYEDPKYDYDYLLPTLANNGANFFRSWMAPNNFPLEWHKVVQTKRYSDSDEYFHPGGAQRLDEVLELCDSLGLYIMIAFDSHNTLIPGRQWEIHNYNSANGGPADTPDEFFSLPESRERYKNRLRYLVARWGYSTSVGAWEFFNEIDNAAFTKKDSIVIPHEVITDWHQEMAAYLKSIDPYDHIVTTSVSHREIEGMYALDELDLNQMHVYKRTKQIPEEILMYVSEYNKPFSWGEFGYEWDWNLDFSEFEEESDYDYKRGLWYGLFNPTPILPMTWWWEFFDERNMTPYFNSVRQISDMMLDAGKGSFERIDVESEGLQSFGVKCGETYFVCVLNNDYEQMNSAFRLQLDSGNYKVQVYDPDTREFESSNVLKAANEPVSLPDLTLKGMDEMLFVLTPTTE